jgi:hypothetical protein
MATIGELPQFWSTMQSIYIYMIVCQVSLNALKSFFWGGASKIYPLLKWDLAVSGLCGSELSCPFFIRFTLPCRTLTDQFIFPSVATEYCNAPI